MAESGGNVWCLGFTRDKVLMDISANMKVITSIYLNCRPDLRDEWLTGSEVEDVQGALVGSNCRLVSIVTIVVFPGPGDCFTDLDQIL